MTSAQGNALRLMSLMLEQAVLEALLSDRSVVVLEVPANTPDEEARQARTRLVAELAEREETLANFEAQKMQLEASIETSRLRAERINDVLPGLQDRLERAKRLRAEQLISILELQDIERSVEVEETNLELIDAQIAEFNVQISGIEQQQITFLAQERAQAEERLTLVRGQIDELEQQQRALSRNLELRRMLSPETGTVQELVAYTVGGVISPGEVVMKIAPESFELEGEALILNQDRGFVRESLPTKIKLQAFPFTKYGFLEGEIGHISSDAVDDQRLGPVFSTTVTFDQREILVDGEMVKLTPGMVAQFEVQTGQKRVLEFLISPLLRYRDEALRER